MATIHQESFQDGEKTIIDIDIDIVMEIVVEKEKNVYTCIFLVK